jgi:hypothetical protein
MGCGYPFPKDFQSYKFHVHKKKVIEGQYSSMMSIERVAIFDLDVSAFLCKNCELGQRKNYIQRMIIIGLLFSILFVPVNIRMALRHSTTALLTFLILTSIFYVIFTLISWWHLKNRFNPAKSLIGFRIVKKDLYFKFKSPKFATTFKYNNPRLNIIEDAASVLLRQSGKRNLGKSRERLNKLLKKTSQSK